MKVTNRMEMFNNADPRLRIKGGLTLFGEDAEGHSFTWYIDAAAEQYLIDQERCEISYPCLPDITNEELAALNQEPFDSSRTQSWPCEPLVIIDDEGEV